MSESVFFHADLDAFFASVEQLDDPSLAGKPVIVGAMPGKAGSGLDLLLRGARLRNPLRHAHLGGLPPLPARRLSAAANGALRPPSAEVMEAFASFTPECSASP